MSPVDVSSGGGSSICGTGTKSRRIAVVSSSTVQRDVRKSRGASAHADRAPEDSIWSFVGQEARLGVTLGQELKIDHAGVAGDALRQDPGELGAAPRTAPGPLCPGPGVGWRPRRPHDHARIKHHAMVQLAIRFADHGIWWTPATPALARISARHAGILPSGLALSNRGRGHVWPATLRPGLAPRRHYSPPRMIASSGS